MKYGFENATNLVYTRSTSTEFDQLQHRWLIYQGIPFIVVEQQIHLIDNALVGDGYEDVFD